MTRYSRNLTSLLLLTLALGACVLPASYAPPTASGSDLLYTAAAQTIAAEINAPPPGATGAPPGTPASGSPTEPALETLPPTSTPLPSRTPLPSDTPTPTLTATPAPTATPLSDDPGQRLGPPTWRDNFKSGENWVMFSDAHVDMAIESDGLRMTALYADKWESWMLRLPLLDLADFYLEAIVKTGECRGLDRYGLVARATNDTSQFYLLSFSCDGQYALRFWDGAAFTYLVEWTPSDLILKGPEQTNRLGLLAQGETLKLYANGASLTEVQDQRRASGAFGLAIGSVSTAGFNIYVSEVSYWEISAP